MVANPASLNRLPKTRVFTPLQKANLMLFGAPGVGKGTFAKMIQKDFDFKQFSTGDYFRHIIKQSETVGDLDDFQRNLTDTLKSGKLVDDEVVIDILNRLSKHPEEFMEGAFAN